MQNLTRLTESELARLGASLVTLGADAPAVRAGLDHLVDWAVAAGVAPAARAVLADRGAPEVVRQRAFAVVAAAAVATAAPAAVGAFVPAA
jgi:hypothetical protein